MRHYGSVPVLRYETLLNSMLFCTTRGNQKVPRIFWHRRFGAPWVHTTWTKCYWSFLHASFFFSRGRGMRGGRDSGFCTMITHHCLLCTNSCHHPTTTLSSSCSEWILAVHCSENRPQGGVSQLQRTSNRMRWPNSRRFRKKSFTGAPKNGGINRARERERECACVYVCWGDVSSKRCHLS
jgi:hypothetical protein